MASTQVSDYTWATVAAAATEREAAAIYFEMRDLADFVDARTKITGLSP